MVPPPPRVRRWTLLELGDADRADDAAQEALVRLLRHVRRLEADRSLDETHALVREM